MKPFKFFQKKYIARAHDGGYIYAEQYFYTMNKEEFMGVSGRMVEKYSIVTRFLPKIYEDQFKPDYNSLWYFRSKQNAEYLRTIWEREDRIRSGEIFSQQSDITITFNRG